MVPPRPSPPDFQALFEGAPAPLLALAPDLTIVAMSDAYGDVTMRDRRNLVGRNIFEAFPDNPDDPTADGVDNLRASLDRVLQSRRPDAMPVLKYDIQRPTAEGGGFEERYWSPLNTPILGPDGNVAWILHRVEDVTELVRLKAGEEMRNKVAYEQQVVIDQLLEVNRQTSRAEAEQRRNAALFGDLFVNGPLPKCVYDPVTLQILAANDAATDSYGYTRDELLAMTIADLMAPDDAARVRAHVDALEQTAYSSGWQLRCKDGRIVHIDTYSHALTLEGKPARIVVAVDVGTRQAAEEQLHQSQKMEAVGQLTGGLAHDFNNLLLVIMGNVTLLQELIDGDPEGEELVAEIHGAARRGAELTHSLLAFARRQTLQPKRADVNTLVSEIMKLLGRTLGEHIEIALDLVPESCPVLVDPIQLEAALANLATNARDAMSKGGRLTIATANRRLGGDYVAEHPEAPPGDYVLIEVTDTGAGMTPDVLARVFEPFFTTKKRGQGTGLGLSMVFGFMRQSGGHINVYSEPGVGTTFRLYLPRDREISGVHHEAAADGAPRGHGERVLVVEDNDALRKVVMRQLSQLGYRVDAAENAAGALALLSQSGPVDLLFTDIVMAGKVDGFDLSRIVAERWPDTRIVMTSGFPDRTLVEPADSHNLVRLLSKPYLQHDLARTVREALDGA